MRNGRDIAHPHRIELLDHWEHVDPAVQGVHIVAGPCQVDQSIQSVQVHEYLPVDYLPFVRNIVLLYNGFFDNLLDALADSFEFHAWSFGILHEPCVMAHPMIFCRVVHVQVLQLKHHFGTTVEFCAVGVEIPRYFDYQPHDVVYLGCNVLVPDCLCIWLSFDLHVQLLLKLQHFLDDSLAGFEQSFENALSAGWNVDQKPIDAAEELRYRLCVVIQREYFDKFIERVYSNECLKHSRCHDLISHITFLERNMMKEAWNHHESFWLVRRIELRSAQYR